MTIGALLSSPHQTQIATHRAQRQAEFQQFSKDLQSGNLPAAQKDFAAFTSMLSGSKASSASNRTALPQNTLAQDFQKLGLDLQSGNLSAAQQDYTQLKQDVQKMHAPHHHQVSTDAINSTESSAKGLLSLLTNAATTAATAYASGGLTGLSTAGSLISALV